MMYAKKRDEELKRLCKDKKKTLHELDITDWYYHNIYGNLERTFYAFMIDNLPQMPDMWDSNSDKRTKSLIKADDYTYFFINTMVGVGSKNDEKVERVHIRFAMIPMDRDIPEPEIILIYPNYLSKVIGEIASHKEIESERQYGIGGKGSGGFTSSSFQLGLMALFNFFKRSSISKKVTTTFPNEILITNASGCGNHAIWEFYRGEGIQDVGQYNLEIIFRIPCSIDKIKFGKGSYCVNWNIEVNGMKLMDHTDDMEQKDKWNTPSEADPEYKKRFQSIINREYTDMDKILLRPINLVKPSNNGRLDTFSFMQK